MGRRIRRAAARGRAHGLNLARALEGALGDGRWKTVSALRGAGGGSWSAEEVRFLLRAARRRGVVEKAVDDRGRTLWRLRP